jgi:hypothetical protein
LFVDTNFTGEGLFVYLSSFLENAITDKFVREAVKRAGDCDPACFGAGIPRFIWKNLVSVFRKKSIKMKMNILQANIG